MKDFVVIIPAYNPMNELPNYIKNLLDENVLGIVVVDDGSDQVFSDLFENITQLERTIVLKHEVNMGKGAALKTGFNYINANYSHVNSVVTADSDGQHLVVDVVNVGDEMVATLADYILGTRNFARSGVPFRSRIGNWFTSLVFALFFQLKIRDTQTGLRAFKTNQLENLMKVSGNRFEYEINMLIMIAKEKHTMDCVAISTVYHDEHTSHYSTIKDSVSIGKQMVKGLFVSK